MKKFLALFALLFSGAVCAQAPLLVNCVQSPPTPCNTVANPGTGTQGDAIWLGGGKLNYDIQTLWANAASVIAYGADPNGVIDSTANINAACSTQKAVLFPPGTYLVSATLTCSVAYQALIFQDALLQASGSFTSGTYVLNLSGNNQRVYYPKIDADNVADGMELTGFSAHIFSPEITHFAGNGLAYISGGNDNFVYDSKIQQWQSGDSQWATDANFTANAVYVNQADSYLIGGTTRWSGVNIYLDNGAGTFWIIDHHMYNGRSSASPRIDPINVHVAPSATNIYFDTDYFDNGHVDLYSPAVSFRDSFLLQNNHVTFTDNNYVRVYANGQTAPFQLSLGFLQVSLGATNPIAYLPFGANSWLGDWTGLPTVIGSGSWQNLTGSSGEVFIHNHADQAEPDRIDYKPLGQINWNFQIGASTASQLSFTNTQGTFNQFWNVGQGLNLTTATGAPISAPAWGLNGLAISGNPRTLNDSSSSGAVGEEAASVIPFYTITATSPVTFNNFDSLYLWAPSAGTNVTITNPWSLRTQGAIESETFIEALQGMTVLGQGAVFGAPTGGNMGPGTANMTGCYVNGVACSTGGGGSPNFGAITSGSNASATMNVAPGASLQSTGGPITATNLAALTGLPNENDQTVVGNGTGVPNPGAALTLTCNLVANSTTLGATYPGTGVIITAGSYAITSADMCGALKSFNGTTAVSLSSAASAGFTAGASVDLANVSATVPLVVTPTTSTIFYNSVANANLTIPPETQCSLRSNGTNYDIGLCTAIVPGVGNFVFGNLAVSGNQSAANSWMYQNSTLTGTASSSFTPPRFSPLWFATTADTVVCSGGALCGSMFLYDDLVTGWDGSHNLANFYLEVDNPPVTPGQNAVGMNMLVNANSSLGGLPGSYGLAQGPYFAFNPNLFTNNSNMQNTTLFTTQEIDTKISAGATTNEKHATTAVTGAADAVQGTYIDSMFGIATQDNSGTSAWRFLFEVGNYAHAAPTNAASVIFRGGHRFLGGNSSPLLLGGFDLTGFTGTSGGFAYKSYGFETDWNGDIYGESIVVGSGGIASQNAVLTSISIAPFGPYTGGAYFDTAGFPAITIDPSQGGGTQAAASVATMTLTAALLNVAAGVPVAATDVGCSNGGTLTLTGGTGTQATLTLTVAGGHVTALVIATPGNYTAKSATPSTTGGGCSVQPTIDLGYGIATTTIGNAGTLYTANPPPQVYTTGYTGGGLVNTPAALSAVMTPTSVPVPLEGGASIVGAIIAAGTKFTVAGSGGGCGTIGTTTGGAMAGKFVAGAVTSCQVSITFGGGLTLPHDSTCFASDNTTPVDLPTSITSSPTGLTVNYGTIVSGDVLKWGCVGY